ncbi:tyrosinase family protein [Sorangium sp. So ce1099]|uniref:tyrosinase family protein n=1 Tax=Sorangium sp. So ce1099 TaxID=3133331 RepID=UPI003F608209
MLNYIDASVLAEHANGHDWHHPSNGELFFSRHRDYIAKLEAFLAASGQGAFVPLPKWDPHLSIPTEFLAVKPLPGVPLTPLNSAPNQPPPANVLSPAAFGTVSAYARAVEPWHDIVHGAIGGAMSSVSAAPAALIFWCWHAYLDDLYWDWQRLAPYQEFRLQTGTALHQTDATFEFAVAGNRDVFAIKKSGTGTGTTEIHVLSASSGYQQFSVQTGTALHQTDATFEFAVAGNRDVFAIKKSGTGTGTTEIHVLSASSGYQQFSLQTGTALHQTDATFEFAVAANRDVFAIKKSGTGTGATEIHVLSASSGYQQFSLQTGTALHQTDATFEFTVAGNRDVFAIKKRQTGAGATEIHVLSASRGYGGYTLQTGTTLHQTDNTFEFGVASNRDVFAIKKSGTGSGTTEIHVLRR